MRASVIVPTCNRPEPLRACLASLAMQEGVEDFDVVVVDDAAAPDPAVVACVAASPLPVHLLHAGGRGAATARNAGLAHCDGELLVFLDGDSQAPPHWLATHLRAHAEAPGEIVVTGPALPLRSSWTLAERAACAWWRDENRARSRGLASADVDLISGNLSIPRAVLRRIGGFDAAFGALRREDYELGGRLHAAGIEIVHRTDAAVSHDLGTTTAGRLTAAQAEGAGDRRMAMMRPDLVAAFAARAPYHYPQGRRERAAGAAWRRPRGRRLLVTALDALERARLVRAWLTMYTAAQDAARRAGAGRQPYGTAFDVPVASFELDGDGPLDLPRGHAVPIEVRWRGRAVGIARPRGGRYDPEFSSELARQLPPEVLLASREPAPAVTALAPDQLGELTPEPREMRLLLLSCDGTPAADEWLTRAAVALEARKVAAVVHTPGRLPAGHFELHGRRRRRVPHTVLGMPPAHVLIRAQALADGRLQAGRLTLDAGPWVAALDLLEQVLASGQQVGVLAPLRGSRPLGRDAQRGFWHARGLLEVRDAQGAASYVRRHAIGSARQIRLASRGRGYLAAAYLRGVIDGYSRRA